MGKDKNNLNQPEEIIESAETKKKKFSFKKLTFYKTKRFYTILIIVFSVLLAAVLVSGPLAKMGSAFASAASFGSMGGFDIDTDADTDADADVDSDSETDSSSDSDSSDSSSGSSSSSDSEDEQDIVGSDSGSMPSGGLPSGSPSDSSSDDSADADFPSGSDSQAGDMPSGGEMMQGNDISGDTSSEEADSSGSESADASISRAGTGLGFVQWYGSYYRIIALILLILDAASIVMRVITAKKQKRMSAQALKDQARQEGKVYIDRGPVKKEKNAKTAWIIPVCVVLAIILIVNLISSGGATAIAQTQASDLSGTVQTGTIAQTVPGAGTLESEDAVDLSFAEGVTVTKWYVSNGDTVSQGDTLAKVDKTTVLSAIATVQEAIDTIDEEIASHEDDEISDTITAASDGRVKAIYASEDESVVDVMYESGSLMVISLDGLMAVEIETDSLSAGDAVTVELSSGDAEEGTVESVANGCAVITISDDGPDIGDSVTVTDSDGNEIGSGELYVHSALKVTGFSGTVSSISVSEEDEVSAGDTLISLEDTDYTAEYEALVETRSELSDQISKLFELYATGYLYATQDGVISGIDSGSTSDDSSDDSEDDSETSEDESDSSDDAASADATSLGAQSEEISVTTVNTAAAETSDSGDDSEAEEEESESADGSENIVGYVSQADVSEDGTYVTVTITTLDSEEETVTISSQRSVYTIEDGSFTETDINGIEEGYIIFYFSDSSLPVYVFDISETSGSDGSSSDSDSQSGSDSDQSAQDSTQGSDGTGNSLNQDGQSGSSSEDASFGMTGETSASDASSLAADASQTASSTDETATTEETVSTAYSVSETVLCSITPQDYMTVEITVDELDILSLSAGQSATVTLDAYAGQSFEGEVISVSLSPENSGGNSKYTAVIQIEKTEDMLEGMNASVSITVEETEDILIIPAAAVFEEDGLYYVYTSFDEKSGTYSDAVEVTLGVSDGEYVEVTDGLSEGDEYFYSYLDTVNYSSTTVSGSGAGLFSFGGM